jgi:hypothetical protein
VALKLSPKQRIWDLKPLAFLSIGAAGRLEAHLSKSNEEINGSTQINGKMSPKREGLRKRGAKNPSDHCCIATVLGIILIPFGYSATLRSRLRDMRKSFYCIPALKFDEYIGALG